MATMIIRDDALWAKHVEGDPEIERRIRGLAPDETIVLRIDGQPIRFRKMRHDQDGRPTEALKADSASAAAWSALQRRRGSIVSVDLELGPSVDPYLLSLSATLSEWNSAEDSEAYDAL